MDLGIKGRVALVTGGARSLGKADCLALAAEGCRIVVLDLNAEGADSTAREIADQGGFARGYEVDITNRAQLAEVVGKAQSEVGPVDICVNNAGIIYTLGQLKDMEDADWDAVLDTNLHGFYNVLRPVVMPMVSARKGGRIVTLSSISGLAGNRGQVNYSAAKAGIIGATKALSVELAKRAITVNCVAPGIIATRMTADLPLEEIVRMIPLRRIGRPEDVAGVVAFLCSDEAAYITRQVISVNGGMI